MVKEKIENNAEWLEYILSKYNYEALVNINNNLNLIIDKFIEKKQEQY